MGRNLDYEFSYGEKITIMPRHYKLNFRYDGTREVHYAIIGMAHVTDGYPLYYDAVNEKGLGMAGLNFVGNAVYSEVDNAKVNVTQYEFISWILSQCANIAEAKEYLEKMNLVGTAYSDMYPAAKLHWIIADSSGAVTVESVEGGLKIYDNRVGILTNNPPFDMQMFNLNNYMNLSPGQPANLLAEDIGLTAYSRGMGALGLPGDLSSASRFVRACYTKLNSLSGQDEEADVGQFFHILGSVGQQRGCCEVADGKYEITIYTSCWNADKGIYYYTTYNNHTIMGVDMHCEDLESEEVITYPMIDKETFVFQNRRQKND